VVEGLTGIDRISTLLICFPSIPWTLPSVRTFFPPSRIHSIPHHRSHLATPLAQAHHRSCHISLPTLILLPRSSTSSMTSFYSTIVINDFIPSSSLHHHDTLMTSQPGLSLGHVSDSSLMPLHIHFLYTFHFHLHH